MATPGGTTMGPGGGGEPIVATALLCSVIIGWFLWGLFALWCYASCPPREAWHGPAVAVSIIFWLAAFFIGAEWIGW
ncbi:MAG: hypothetical protein AAGI46_07590 [Planctomycetota bacterium]